MGNLSLHIGSPHRCALQVVLCQAMLTKYRFPCWVRAIYSFSAESRKDLGFCEGQLIECLNAGDGSWWVGRLHRDKRVTGMFPSNFVEVLDDSFRPASRASSPMPDRSPSPNPFNPQPPTKAKSKAFRKPFQAYSAPDQAKLKRDESQKKNSLGSVRAPSPNPNSAHNNIRNVPPPNIHGYGSRAPSPSLPSHYNSYSSRAHSPAPPMHYGGSRAPSPAPSIQYKAYSREPSPEDPFELGSSPPPPPPPPHRSIYTPHVSTNSYDHSNGYHTPARAISPAPPSPGPTGMTPSPLRDAMHDVMSSLADMGVSRDTESPKVPLDPWSPEAFDQTYTKARRNAPIRPNTAMGTNDREYGDYDGSRPFMGGSQSHHPSGQPPAQLSNYVQRMETRLNKMHTSSPRYGSVDDDEQGVPPVVPPKPVDNYHRPKSSMGISNQVPKLRHKKSAYEVGRSILSRTLTTKTNSTSSSSGGKSTTTNSSSSTDRTDKSIMSGASAGAFSATSAGSLARKKEALHSRAQSAFGSRKDNWASSQADFTSRPGTPLTGISFHSSHATEAQAPRSKSQAGWHGSTTESGSILGGLMAPKPKKSGFFKKMIESAKTGAASARSNIGSDSSRPPMPSSMGSGVSSIAGGYASGNQSRNAVNEMGLGNAGVDWVQVRRDVNRSNTLSKIERRERIERCQMMDYPAINPVDELFHNCDGDEGADGNPVAEPMSFQNVNLGLVDKNARFINSLPPMTNPVSLATGYVCRPYRSDVQRLRAIFTWVSEKLTWEEDFESDIDSRRVIQTKRACAEEVAVLVAELCGAVGIHAEIIKGYLKIPGEEPDLNNMPRPNHWWNGVIVDGEWRIMDCSLASPSNPRRSLYSSASSREADSFWFLARPTEICWTHVPEQHQQQHLCPPMAHEILLALPCACPPFFKNGLEMVEYDTSLIRIEDLELVHVKFTVPADVECVAEVEARAYERDADGDCFESGDVVKKRALSQAEWVGGQKRYTVKALLPGDEGHGVLKIYAGKRGLMHSIKDIVHPLAFAIPIIHTGDNPEYEFLTRHPTPHAQRHDLYVAQPQCQRLACNNTFVFAIRQHPSSIAAASPNPGGTSPIPFIRPGSAMSMTSSSASGSNPSTYTSKKPAKLAIQSPGGKILRLMRKEDRGQSTSQPTEGGDGGTWETIIKCGERGVWRGLVLADRSARWCVFAEWTCV